jgi:Ankyrin repeats (3 copies)
MKALAIKHAQDVNSPRFHNEATPLHLASRNGYVERFVDQWRQVAGTRVSEKQWLTPLRQTPLHQASQSGTLEVARLLIEHGADLAVQDKHGNSYMMRRYRRVWKLHTCSSSSAQPRQPRTSAG